MASKNNDFFNLNSESESDAETNKSKCTKWDWDDPKNVEIYYKVGQNEDESVEKLEDNSKSVKRSNQNTKTELKSKKQCVDDAHVYHNNISDQKIKLGNSQLNFKYSLVEHKDTVHRIHWSKRSEHRNLLLSSSADCSIIIWDISNSTKPNIRQKFTKSHSKAIRNAIWSNYSTEIASISYDMSCVISNCETGQTLSTFQCDQFLTAITNCPLDDNIYLIGAKNTIYAWDRRTNRTCKTYKSKMGQVQDLLFINDKEFVSSGDEISRESSQFNIMAWDYESTASISNQIFHEKYLCTCLKKHPNHNLFYAQTHGGYIAEFSSRSPYKMNKFKRFEGHKVNGYNIGFDLNPSGSLLITGSCDGNAIVYNVETSEIISKFSVFRRPLVQPCMDAKFNAFINNKIAIASWNGVINIYEPFINL